MVDEVLKKKQATTFTSEENTCDELFSAKSPFFKDFKVKINKYKQ